MPGAPLIDVGKAAQADALAQSGYRPMQIERLTGIDEASVRDILRRHGRWGEIAATPVFARLRSEQTRAMEAALRVGAAQAIIEAYKPEKLAEASHRDLMVGIGISIDKFRLLAGESTQNVDLHVQVSGLDDLAASLGQALISTAVSPSSTDKESGT